MTGIHNSDAPNPKPGNRVGLDQLISLQQAVELSGLSVSYLRLLVSQGTIWGMKVGRNWVTTTQAIEEFLSTERKRGPKPKQPNK